MSGEHKTVQARILAYAQEIGRTFVSREEAERRRGFNPEGPPAARARNRSHFFDDLLDVKVREFSPCYTDAEGVLLDQFRYLHINTLLHKLMTAKTHDREHEITI